MTTTSTAEPAQGCHHSARTHDDQGCMVVCDCTATYEEAKETHK